MSRRSWAGALCVVNVGLAIGLAIDVARRLASPAFIGATDFTAFRAGWWLALHDPRHLYDAAAQRAVEQAIGRGLGSPGFVSGMLAFLHPPHMALGGCGLEWLADHRGGRVGAAEGAGLLR